VICERARVTPGPADTSVRCDVVLDYQLDARPPTTVSLHDASAALPK
jgi:hypothetical protein